MRLNPLDTEGYGSRLLTLRENECTLAVLSQQVSDSSNSGLLLMASFLFALSLLVIFLLWIDLLFQLFDEVSELVEYLVRVGDLAISHQFLLKFLRKRLF